ncbi:MAG: hypothetical protein V1753_08320 [Pseudomonadota bacterium]
MPKYQTIFEYKEEIYGVVPRANDWVHYTSILRIKDGGKVPVSLEMIFVPPHPFAFNMPEKHFMKAKNVTGAYTEVVKFFKSFGIEFKS